MNGFQEFHYWSPIFGADVVRISMFDERGDEFYTTIPEQEGRLAREAREAALDALMAAIQRGEAPGEVMAK